MTSLLLESTGCDEDWWDCGSVYSSDGWILAQFVSAAISLDSTGISVFGAIDEKQTLKHWFGLV